MITHHPISWWVKKLDEPFSLARFGDGEFLCIEGKQGRNSHGCSYTPELRADLISVLRDNRILKGMQRIEPRQLHKVRPLLQGEWVDTEVFSEALAEGELKPFFDKLRGMDMDVVIVSSKEKDIFPIPHDFVETPKTNAHAEKNSIVNEVLIHMAARSNPTVFLFACGMAAGTFVSALHGQGNHWFLDIGHILDPFIGDPSREYLKHVPQETLLKNV